MKTVSNSILDFYRETKEKNGKKSHPFISAEKRFSLTKTFLNGNDYEFTHKMPSKKSYCKDHLSGGIAKFININKRKDYSKELFIKKYKKDYYKIRKKFIDDYNKIDFTKRVILPQKNIEKPLPKKANGVSIGSITANAAALGYEIEQIGNTSKKGIKISPKETWNITLNNNSEFELEITSRSEYSF